MLSRAAQGLYHFGRQLERADHAARVLAMHHGLWLDRPKGPIAGFWPEFLELSGFRPRERVTAAAAIDTVLSDLSGPSVRSALSKARSRALAFRPSLSTEVYEQVNILYWQLVEADPRQDLHGLLSRVQLGIHLVFGLIEDTMSHNQSWDFICLGKHLERAGGVTNLVTRKLPALAAGGDDPVEWATVLKCCNAFEAFRQRFSAPVTPDRVAGFLLLDGGFPRSAGYCVRAASDAIVRIDGPRQRTRPHRLVGQLASLLAYADETEVVGEPTQFGMAYSKLAAAVNTSIVETYFLPSRVAASIAPPEPAWSRPMEQQQQQAGEP